MGHRLELDDDLGALFRQALAGAHEEGHASPTPVVDVGADGDEGLGVRILTPLLVIALDRLALAGPGHILAAHGDALGLVGGDGAKRAQHLDLFVAHRVRVQVAGRLHRHQAQQLQHMVLQHVPQRAVFVVIGPAVADPHGLADGDLDVVDRQIVPQRLEDGVAEPQGDQVLHRLLAQIVVDAEHLVLAEGVGHGVVDVQEGRQVAPDRLFQNDAAVLFGQTGGLHRRYDAGVQRRGHGQERGDLAVAHLVLQRFQAVGRGGVHRQIIQPRLHPRPAVLVPRLVGLGLGLHRVVDLGDIVVGAFVRTRGADDLQPVGQQTVVLEEIQRRQQHAHRQIAAAAEQNESRHGLSLQRSRFVGPTPLRCRLAFARFGA